jgi:cell division septation protein DedD
MMVEKASCCSNRDSVDLIGGYNFTEDNGALDDAATIGIRYNKNVAPNTYVQLGYERVLNSDYKKGAKKLNRSVTGDYGDSENGENSNGSNSGNGSGNDNGNNSNGSGNANGTGGSSSGGTNVGTNPSSKSTKKHAGGTQLDRFYLNGMYEFCGASKLTPYLFGGLGYENVRHESSTLESGGFANAGAGLKYQIGENLNLLTEAKAIKKFDNDDLDIVAGVGIGMMFGAAATQMVPVSEFEIAQPAVVPSIIPADAPLATPVVIQQSVPAYNPMYENLDVVTIDTEGRDSINSRRTSHRAYNSNGGDYYIQVAALFKNNGANSTYFRKLDAQGLNHQLKNTTVRGKNISLLLVGPYDSKSAANADLGKVKSVERGAFVKRVKS